MTKKTNKELLFERMEAVNPDFKRPQENIPNSEQEIVNDILSLNEGIDNILNKIKEYGKRGLLTAAILLAVAVGSNAQEHEYFQIMKVGRDYSEEPYIDSKGVQHVGKERMSNADFNVTDVNYFYLALAVQKLNTIIGYSRGEYYPPVNFSREVDAYGDEIPLSSAQEKVKKNLDDAYYFAMGLYNILQSNQSDEYYEKINSRVQGDLFYNSNEWTGVENIQPNNGVNRILAYISNGKNIKLVDGKFVGGLDKGEFPSPTTN